MSMEKFSFSYTKSLRKELLEKYGAEDSVFFEGKNNVLISVPHGVSQTRLGRHKVAEIGTIPMGVILANNTNSHLLIKTKNNFDDANFDIDCDYRKCLTEIIKKHNIKYLLDIHGLAKWREMDINLGASLGNSVKNNTALFEKLVLDLKSNFKVTIDQPFMGAGKCISGYYSKKLNIWAVQIEVNCAITNNKENIEKFNKLLSILVNWLNSNLGGKK